MDCIAPQLGAFGAGSGRQELIRIGKNDGLPPASHGIVLHPIEAGRVLVAGSFGNNRRGWIAIVEFNGSTSKVKVIHEATKSRFNMGVTYTADSTESFVPCGVIEHVTKGDKPRRKFFIIRGGWIPLIVDVETLEVQLYPGNETNNKWFPRFCDPVTSDVFLSDQGILWIAAGYSDFSSYRFNEETGFLETIREHPETNSQNITSGSLARDGEWLYHAGHSMWRRLNLKTGEEDVLLKYTNQLPHYGSGDDWHLYHSAHYGLVGFCGGDLYKIKVNSSKSNKKKSIKNSLRVRTYWISALGVVVLLIAFALLVRRQRSLRNRIS